MGWASEHVRMQEKVRHEAFSKAYKLYPQLMRVRQMLGLQTNQTNMSEIWDLLRKGKYEEVLSRLDVDSLLSEVKSCTANMKKLGIAPVATPEDLARFERSFKPKVLVDLAHNRGSPSIT